MKARKKPVIIDFFPIDESTFIDVRDLREWVIRMGADFDQHFILRDHPLESKFLIAVKTLEGTSYDVTSNHVIICGVKQEFYPCEKSIFEQTYEIIE